MLAIQDLEQAGYRRYSSPGTHLADALYQKGIWRDGKLLFHVNIYYYDGRKYGDGGDGFQTEVNLVSGSMMFQTTLYHGSQVDVQFIERWLTSLFDNMNCTAIDDGANG